MTETMDRPLTIAMCTFRRSQAFDALDSLCELVGVDPEQLAVLVIDNDEHDGLREKFSEYAASYPYDLTYVHAPAKNISIARNAALDAADTRWMAFIDDDELATSNWLIELTRSAWENQAVVGRCVALYGAELPDWATRCDFHSTRINQDCSNAYSGNVLIDREFVHNHDIRFRIDLGKTGGEDTIFFKELVAAGGRIVYRPDAVVIEPVPEARANMRWVRRRMYRAGQTHGLVCRDFDPKAYCRLGVTAGAKMVVSGLMSVATIPGTDRSRKWIGRAALHAGALRYRLKPSILEEYG